MKKISEDKKWVLLVEDNPADFLEFSRLLNQLGYSAIQKPDLMPVSSYEDALDILRSNQKIEFALLDINLTGEKSGVDIAEYILKNKFPIRIIFTTAYLSAKTANEIAYIGRHFATIPKPSGIVHSEISLFNLQQMIAPVNPLQEKLFDNIFVSGIIINPLKSIKEQLADDTLKYRTRVIAKSSVYYILTGNSLITVPKNKSLIITEYSREAVLANACLKELIDENLDDRFVRINDNICINLEHYEGEISKGGGLEISVVSSPFTVTKKYLPSFQQKLARYRLVPA